MKQIVSLLALAFTIAASPAQAGLTAAQLATVEVRPPPGAQVPLATLLRDEDGRKRALKDVVGARPALLIFADYTCRTLCGPVIAMTAAASMQTGLRPGGDFRLVIIGLDPKDGPAAARKMKSEQLSGQPAIAQAATFLSGDAAAIAALTKAVGYRYVYDAANDQFAHPNAVLAIAADGHVARALSGLGLTGADLRLALVDASAGRIGGLVDRLRLLCYGFDPVQGVYTERILGWLQWASGLTAAALAATVLLMLKRTGRRTS